MSQQYTLVQSLLMLIGRIGFSMIFIIAGSDKIMNFSKSAAMLADKDVEAASVVLALAIVFELGGGLLILLGWYARFGALLIFLFIIPVTYMFHAFWAMEGQSMINNMQHFMKNASLLGGAVYIISCGAGHISVDGFLRKKA